METLSRLKNFFNLNVSLSDLSGIQNGVLVGENLTTLELYLFTAAHKYPLSIPQLVRRFEDSVGHSDISIRQWVTVMNSALWLDVNWLSLIGSGELLESYIDESGVDHVDFESRIKWNNLTYRFRVEQVTDTVPTIRNPVVIFTVEAIKDMLESVGIDPKNVSLTGQCIEYFQDGTYRDVSLNNNHIDLVSLLNAVDRGSDRILSWVWQKGTIIQRIRRPEVTFNPLDVPINGVGRSLFFVELENEDVYIPSTGYCLGDIYKKLKKTQPKRGDTKSKLSVYLTFRQLRDLSGYCNLSVLTAEEDDVGDIGQISVEKFNGMNKYNFHTMRCFENVTIAIVRCYRNKKINLFKFSDKINSADNPCHAVLVKNVTIITEDIILGHVREALKCNISKHIRLCEPEQYQHTSSWSKRRVVFRKVIAYDFETFCNASGKQEVYCACYKEVVYTVGGNTLSECMTATLGYSVDDKFGWTKKCADKNEVKYQIRGHNCVDPVKAMIDDIAHTCGTTEEVVMFAHNGARFDTYMVINNMKTIESAENFNFLKTPGGILDFSFDINRTVEPDKNERGYFVFKHDSGSNHVIVKKKISPQIKFKFRDTNTYLTGSLHKLCDSFNIPKEISKMDFNIGKINEENYLRCMEDWFEYAKNDVLCLCAMVCIANSMFRKLDESDFVISQYHTLPALVENRILKAEYNFKAVTVSDHICKNFERKAYYGGRTQVGVRDYHSPGWHSYYEKLKKYHSTSRECGDREPRYTESLTFHNYDAGDLVSTTHPTAIALDVNSLYPFCMAHFVFTLGEPRVLTVSECNILTASKISKYFERGVGFIVRFKFMKPPKEQLNYGIVPIRTKTGVKYSLTSETDVHYHSVDIIEALRFGYSFGPVQEGIIYQGVLDNKMQHFILDLFEKRLQAKKESNKLMDMTYKLCMNSTYGRLGMRTYDTDHIVTKTDEKMDGNVVKIEDSVELDSGLKIYKCNFDLGAISNIRRKGVVDRTKTHHFPRKNSSLNTVYETKFTNKCSVELSGSRPTHIAIQIAALSRRWMNNIIKVLEKNGVHWPSIIYQDTDSYYLPTSTINILKRHGFLGNKLGQMKNDYGSDSRIVFGIFGARKVKMCVVLDKDGEVDLHHSWKGNMLEQTYYINKYKSNKILKDIKNHSGDMVRFALECTTDGERFRHLEKVLGTFKEFTDGEEVVCKQGVQFKRKLDGIEINDSSSKRFKMDFSEKHQPPQTYKTVENVCLPLRDVDVSDDDDCDDCDSVVSDIDMSGDNSRKRMCDFEYDDNGKRCRLNEVEEFVGEEEIEFHEEGGSFMDGVGAVLERYQVDELNFNELSDFYSNL